MLLMDAGAHVFGAVLNAARVTRGGYFREQIRTFYDYQSETASVPAEPNPPAHENDSDDSQDA